MPVQVTPQRHVVVALGNMPCLTQLAMQSRVRPEAIANIPISASRTYRHIEGFTEEVGFLAAVKKATRITLCASEQDDIGHVQSIAGRLSSRLRLSVSIALWNGSIEIDGHRIKTCTPRSTPETAVMACADQRSTKSIESLSARGPVCVFRLAGSGLRSSTCSRQRNALRREIMEHMAGYKEHALLTHHDCAGFQACDHPVREAAAKALFRRHARQIACVHAATDGSILARSEVHL